MALPFYLPTFSKMAEWAKVPAIQLELRSTRLRSGLWFTSVDGTTTDGTRWLHRCVTTDSSCRLLLSGLKRFFARRQMDAWGGRAYGPYPRPENAGGELKTGGRRVCRRHYQN